MSTETAAAQSVGSSAWLAELEAVRRREEWARTRAASGDGVKYTIASAKAEMVNEIIAMWRRHSANVGTEVETERVKP